MNLGVRDLSYLLTGASRGLGQATAAVLLAEGARVAVASRSGGTGDLGPAALGLAADLGDPAAAEELVARTVAHHGGLHGALVSVGGPAAGPALGLTDEAWRAAFDTVFLGALRVVRAVVPPMLAAGAGGSVALVLSTSARQPIAGLGASNGLRPGLAMLVKELAEELGPTGIRVNGLLPGRVATDRLTELDGPDPAVRAAHESRIPLRRYGSPEEFGRAAAFLLSPAASYLTGVLLPVDGGALRAV